MRKLILIDNYDSFTYNLMALFGKLENCTVSVINRDEVRVEDINNFDAILISPGPGKPKDALKTIDVIKTFYKTRPIFGVCLGMQIINELFGGTTEKAPYPMHGKKDKVDIYNSPLFANISSPITVARYHSLKIGKLGAGLKITALNSEDIVMAIEHKEYPLYGVQFHPESFMTKNGTIIAENFMRSIDVFYNKKY